jgi:16S rRNA (guanine527-N7)-methyltransferase
VSGPEEVLAVGDVSRETLARLQVHHDLLARWNRKINLVSKASLADAWRRHFADSAQLWRLRPAAAHIWLDLGSGAGFPGLVIAAIAAEQAPDLEVRLVESDQRKAAFLRAVAQAAGLRAQVLDGRIEELPAQGAGVLSARALAPLDLLLGHAEKHLAPEGIGLFPKGEAVHKELADAKIRWRFEQKLHPSLTDPRGAIVEIGAVNRG